MADVFYNPMASDAASSWADDELDASQLNLGNNNNHPNEHEQDRKDRTVKEMYSASSPVPITYTDALPGNATKERKQQFEATPFRQEPSKEPPMVPPFTGYVGNLPYQMNEDDVARMFQGLNITNIRMPMDYQANRKKGFAYVEFTDRPSLVSALSWNGREFQNRHIRVDVASERKKRSSNDFKDRSSFIDIERQSTKHRDYPSHTLQRSAVPHPQDENPPMERKKLSLLPRSNTTVDNNMKFQSKSQPAIFGKASPRDESAYQGHRKDKVVHYANHKANNVQNKNVTAHSNTNSKTRGNKSTTVARDLNATWTHETMPQGPNQAQGARRESKKLLQKPRRKMSEDEMMKKATIQVAKVTTRVTNAFAAFAMDSDSDSDSDSD